MRTLIFLLFSVSIFAQDTIDIDINGMTTYVVVVEDNMINYPMGKDFPGKVHVVGNGYIFWDTIIPHGFNPLRPVGVHPDATPRFRYFDRNGQAQFWDINMTLTDGWLNNIGSNFNGGWEWNVNCPGCNQRYERFGPGWNNDNWSN